MEIEGIPHNYPVPSSALKQEKKDMKTFSIPLVPEKVDSYDNVDTKNLSQKYQSFNKLKTKIKKYSLLNKNISTPFSFLQEYADRENLNVIYNKLDSAKNLWKEDYAYHCKFENITGEGQGKKKSTAKQEAASRVIMSLIRKQKKGILSSEMTPLSQNEIELGLNLMCQTVDYENELQSICSKKNARPPIYTIVPNSCDNTVRCKALGFNAVGRGKNMEIAKRMSAKFVIDLAKENIRKH